MGQNYFTTAICQACLILFYFRPPSATVEKECGLPRVSLRTGRGEETLLPRLLDQVIYGNSHSSFSACIKREPNTQVMPSLQRERGKLLGEIRLIFFVGEFTSRGKRNEFTATGIKKGEREEK